MQEISSIPLTVASMDQRASSMDGVWGPKDIASSAFMEDPRSLQIVVVGGDGGEEEQPIRQIGSMDNEIPNEVKNRGHGRGYVEYVGSITVLLLMLRNLSFFISSTVSEIMWILMQHLMSCTVLCYNGSAIFSSHVQCNLYGNMTFLLYRIPHFELVIHLSEQYYSYPLQCSWVLNWINQNRNLSLYTNWTTNMLKNNHIYFRIISLL